MARMDFFLFFEPHLSRPLFRRQPLLDFFSFSSPLPLLLRAHPDRNSTNEPKTKLPGLLAGRRGCQAQTRGLRRRRQEGPGPCPGRRLGGQGRRGEAVADARARLRCIGEAQSRGHLSAAPRRQRRVCLRERERERDDI